MLLLPGWATADMLPILRTLSLPFPASDVAFDAGRLRLYATDGAGKRLVAASLTDGATVFSMTFTNTPEALAMRPDGQRLFVGLVVQPHSPYWWEPHDGYIAGIDIENGTSAVQFRTTIDPYDLVATDAGWVVVTDGSAQWTHIASFNAENGAEISRGSIREASHLALHSFQNAFYSADTDVGPSDIQRWNLDPSTGQLSSVGDSPYHGDYPMSGNVWVHPSGSNLVTRGGTVLTSSTNRPDDMRFIRLLDNGPLESVAFDTMHKAVFTVGSGSYPFTTPALSHYGATYELVRSYQLTNTPSYVFVHGDSLFVISIQANQTLVTVLGNPAVGGETNQPPVPGFVWSPAEPTTLTALTFNAAPTTDDTDGPSQLAYRWDWEADGQWDTPFTNSLVADHRYNLAGTKTVRLQVKDHFGAVATLERQFNVALAVDPGQPGGGNPAFEIPFRPADLIHDIARQRLYATDSAGKRLVFLNLTNGFIEREFRFDFTPESMAMTPNAQKLYVALLTRPHDYYYFDTHRGFVAEFDLVSGVKTRELEVALDPGDLVANDHGILVIADGSDQWTDLATVEAATGAIISSVTIYQGARLGLHPSQAAVYAGDVNLSPGDFHRLGFNPTTGVQDGYWESVYHGDYPLGNRPFITPDGSRVISYGGTVLTSSPTQALDLKFVRDLDGDAFSDLVFDSANRAFFTVGSPYYDATTSRLSYYGDSFELVSSETISNNVQRIFATPQSLYLVSLEPTRAVVVARPNPAEGAAENQPPVAAFAWSPTNPTTLTSIQFDASGSTDDDESTLTYRWDWEADGVWNTPFTNAVTISHRYNVAGTKTIRLQVKDRFGAVNTTERTLNVALAVDPGDPVVGGVAFELQFPPADVEFDPNRPHMYATDYAGKRLVRVNTDNGFVEREFRFDYSPESIAITPNGRRMYVALLVRPHGSYYFDTHRSFVAEFDLDSGAKTREMELNIDPFDMVATDSGWIVITDGSDQWTTIASYNAATGARAGQGGIYERARLALHPGQTIIYATDTGLSPSDIHHFDLNPATGALGGGWDSIYHGDYWLGQAVFTTPDGQAVFSAGGTMLTSSSLQQFDLKFIRTLPVNNIADAAYDATRGVVALAGDTRLSLFSTTNYNLLAQYTVLNDARWVDMRAGRILTVSRTSNSAVIQRRRIPAVSVEEDLPPLITWLRPANNAVLLLPGSSLLEVAADDEDGTVTNVSFYADGALIGSRTSAPYQLIWNPLTSGPISLWAVARDNFGLAATSQVVHVRLNHAPGVTLDSPVDGEQLLAPAFIELSASASDADGQIVRVDFLLNDEIIGSRTTPPYRLSYTPLMNGPLSFRAVATDELGASRTSSEATVMVTGFASDWFDPSYPMQGVALTLAGSNQTATKQKGEPSHAGNRGGKSLWWSWTAPGDGTAVLTTEGSNFDTLLAVYTGLSVSNLLLVVANDDDPDRPPTSRVKFKTMAGEEYHIAVDGYEGAAGSAALQINYYESAVVVPNDLFANALPVSGLPFVALGNNVGAAREPSEPFHAGNNGGRSVWWRWIALSSGPVEIRTVGSDFDTLLAVYTRNLPWIPESLSNLRLTAANDDESPGSITSRTQFTAIAGTVYYIAVDGYAAASGNVRLELRGATNDIPVVPTPANDDFTNRIMLTGASVVTQGVTLGASHEAGEPLHAGQAGGGSAWWSWIASDSGQVTVSTKGSSFDTLLAVYTGNTLSALSPEASNDDEGSLFTSMLTFNAAAGVAYHVAVDGYLGAAGDVALSLNQRPSTLHVGALTLTYAPGQGMRLRLVDCQGTIVVIERSTNMIDWTARATNNVVNGFTEYTDSTLFQAPACFYRARLGP